MTRSRKSAWMARVVIVLLALAAVAVGGAVAASRVGTQTRATPVHTLASLSTYGVKLTPILHGTGSRVISFRNGSGGPLELLFGSSANHGNLIAEIGNSSGNTPLVNAIGNYAGLTLFPYATAGRYRLGITADTAGGWGAQIWRLTPSARAPGLFGSWQGHGDVVAQVRLPSRAAPVATSSCSCTGNFIVTLDDYHSGEQVVFNQIGSYHGQQLLDPLPAGNYVVAVEASGPWSLRFTP